jgi:hypothetical protein
LSLRSPPKIYKIQSTDDLHLYRDDSIRNFSFEIDDILSADFVQKFTSLNLGAAPKRLERDCCILPNYQRSAALCMVYQFLISPHSHVDIGRLPSLASGMSRVGFHQPRISQRPPSSFEAEFEHMEAELCRADLNIIMHCTFAVRFQLLALVYEGTLPPTTATELIPELRKLCLQFGPAPVARGIRRLQYQLPSAGPYTDPEELSFLQVLRTIQDNIRDAKVSRSIPDKDINVTIFIRM